VVGTCRRFDAILLDAPCSASGIVRRHPDVRWLRRPSDVAALAAEQARLLDALWPLLASWGPTAVLHLLGVQDRRRAPDRRFLQRQPACQAGRQPAVTGTPAAAGRQ